MIKPKNTILFCLLLVFATINTNNLFAQYGEGGTPPSFNFKSSITKMSAEAKSMPITFDVKALRAEDALNESKNNPPRLAVIIPADFSMDNSGEWTTLPNGQMIWRLTIQAADAIATMLYYDEFYLPEGAKLFIYSKNKEQVLGAYTEKTNPIGKTFATEFITGDELTLEYVRPEGNPKNNIPRIKITGVSYGYNHLSEERKASGSCQVNINCPEGDNWQNPKRGVVRTATRINGGLYGCSGTLINNTANDLTPYYLTAHHCFYDGYNNFATLSTMIFYFNYEYQGCSNSNPTPERTLVGAQMLVNTDINGGSDGVLLQLNDDIPESYDVYWNGWDNRDVAPTSGVCIHHPQGDYKKISTYITPATTDTWEEGSTVGITNGAWRVVFASTNNGYGTTEKGSSGSPLFNQNGLVVGTLSGGSSSCTYKTQPDLYGKLAYHWDKNGSGSNQQMKTYLDPLNTGQSTLTGVFRKQQQTITFPPIDNRQLDSPNFDPGATASSGLPVYYVSNNTKVAVITSDNKVSVVDTGYVKIYAYQDGDDVYRVAPAVSQSFKVLSIPVPFSEVTPKSAFTPNGDGINDYFVINNIEQYANNELVVFDVNGKIHYRQKDYRNNWNGVANTGVYNGKKVPVGTYYYILTVNGKPEFRSYIVIKY